MINNNKKHNAYSLYTVYMYIYEKERENIYLSILYSNGEKHVTLQIFLDSSSHHRANWQDFPGQ